MVFIRNILFFTFAMWSCGCAITITDSPEQEIRETVNSGVKLTGEFVNQYGTWIHTVEFVRLENHTFELYRHGPFDTIRMATFLYESFLNKRLPNSEQVLGCLQNGHIVVVNDNEYEQYCREETIACVTRTDNWANVLEREVNFDLLHFSYFTFFIRERTFFSPLTHVSEKTIIHEMTHVLSGCGFGDTDGDHDDPRLWIALDDEESMQAIALEKEISN